MDFSVGRHLYRFHDFTYVLVDVSLETLICDTLKFSNLSVDQFPININTVVQNITIILITLSSNLQRYQTKGRSTNRLANARNY